MVELYSRGHDCSSRRGAAYPPNKDASANSQFCAVLKKTAQEALIKMEE